MLQKCCDNYKNLYFFSFVCPTFYRASIGAVHEVLNDNLVFPSRIENNLHHQDYFLKNFSLSKRELEVIKLIRKGYSTEDIAKEINLSFETVKSHRRNIFLKLNINKVSELVLFAVSNGI